jgi:hypothetical protein
MLVNEGTGAKVLYRGCGIPDFGGNTRATIIDQGGPDKPTRFQVEYENPSAAQVQEAKDFWESVHGPNDPWRFDHSGTTYEPCYFEAGVLQTELTARGLRLDVKFRATKAAGTKG